MAQPQLTATYSSQSDSRAFTSDPLPVDPKNVGEKTTYLGALRANATKLQGDINAFLTQKMEEDKAAEGSSKKSAADERAEDMYGEEDPEMDG